MEAVSLTLEERAEDVVRTRNLNHPSNSQLFECVKNHLREAVAEEREACAVAALGVFREQWSVPVDRLARETLLAIRARGKTAETTWCEHMRFSGAQWSFTNPPSGTVFYLDGQWRCCPVCGANRPTEAP